MIDETRFVVCGHCGGEGFVEFGNPNAPFAERTEPCCCQGGLEEVEVEPVTEEEMEANGYPIELTEE